MTNVVRLLMRDFDFHRMLADWDGDATMDKGQTESVPRLTTKKAARDFEFPRGSDFQNCGW